MAHILSPNEVDLLDRLRKAMSHRFKQGQWHEPKIARFAVEIKPHDEPKPYAVQLYDYTMHIELEDGTMLDADGLSFA